MQKSQRASANKNLIIKQLSNNMNKHWITFILALLWCLVIFIDKSLNFYNFLLLIFPIIILTVIIKRKNSLATNIGFYVCLLGAIVSIIGIFDALGYFGGGEFRGLSEVIISVVLFAISGISYLVSLFLKK